MLKRLYDRSSSVEFAMERYAASIVFTLTYGKRIGKDDGDLRAVLDILDGFLRDCTTGAHLVDTFPILDLLPDLLSPWRAEARMKHEKEVEVQRISKFPCLIGINIFSPALRASSTGG